MVSTYGSSVNSIGSNNVHDHNTKIITRTHSAFVSLNYYIIGRVWVAYWLGPTRDIVDY